MLPRARDAKLRPDLPRFRRLLTERLEDRSLLALAGYQIHIVPPDGSVSGPELTTINLGESYDLVVTVQDLRSEPTGVFSAYLDIGYDSTKTRVRVAEVQRISIGPFDMNGPAAASGTFALDFGGQTTEVITYNSNAAALAVAVEGALAALSGVGAGHVDATVDVLSSSLATIVQVRFGGKYLDTDVPNLTVAAQSLTGPGNPSVSVSYEGDLQVGSNPHAFKEAFRSRGTPADYQNGLSAKAQPNLLDEVGAFSGIFPLPGNQAREVVRARLIATATGAITFTTDFSHLDVPASDTLLYDVNRRLEIGEIDPGTVKMLTVVGPNVAPSFVKGANQSTNDESGPQSVDGWATAISAGPANEANQALNFAVAVSNANLFDQGPAIDATGKLTYTPKLNAEGTAQVTVVLRDDGGTANGGVDTSESQTFEIQIVKLRPMHNAALPLDASGDGQIVAGDALDCINYLNAYGATLVAELPPDIPKFLDVDADGFLSPGDPLMVINHVNAFGPTTGGAAGPSGESDDEGDFSSLLGLLAEDTAGVAGRRKR